MLSEDGQFDQVGRKASEHVISDGTLEVEERGPGLPKTQTSFNIIQDLISFFNFFRLNGDISPMRGGVLFFRCLMGLDFAEEL